ncbi:MAG: hypothetical protein CMH52_11645 [Myxococcales bacterium]|nr:hypothetical protein [Myxococcales bacterium]
MSTSNARCYRILGLTGEEDINQIKSAYRKLARKLHPDMAGGDEERFKEVTAAYQQLQASLANREAYRTSATNSPRRPRRRRDEARPRSTQTQSETPWRPGQQQTEPQCAERADWSSFEKLYRDRLKKKQKKARSSRSAERLNKHTKQTTQDTPKPRVGNRKNAPSKPSQRSAPVSPSSAAKPKGTGSFSPSSKINPKKEEMDTDFAAAWEAWCENARRFDARHGWRCVETDSPQSVNDEHSSAEESETDRGWRRWFKRGLNRIGKNTSANRMGRDIHLRLAVTVEDLATGARKMIAVKRWVPCPSCSDESHECEVCHGAKRVEVRDTLNVDVPAGAKYGSKLRLTSKGSVHQGGSKTGDLYLELEPADLPGFRRDGADIHGACLISADLARKGGHVTITLARGAVKIRVPERTCIGDRFRLRGQGLPLGPNGASGDAYLTVKVEG